MTEGSFNDNHGLIQGQIEQTFFTIARPRDHKAKVCIWADLTINDIEHLSECSTSEQIRAVLARRFSLQEEVAQHRILLDLFLSLVQFANEHRFNPEQTSAFFSIVKRTHEVAVETPFGNVDQTFNYFRELVLCHAVHRPPFSLGLFSSDEVQVILTYVLDTYFRHFKLYKYAFTPQVRLDLAINYDGMPNEELPPEELPVESAEGEAAEAELELAASSRSEIDEIAPEPAESAAEQQLRELIRTHMAAELKALRLDVDEKLKATEAQLTERLAAGEGSGRRSAKGSAKGKKK